MITYFAEAALLPQGWARNVRIDVDAAGDIVAVAADAPRDGAQPVGGPVVPGMVSLHGDPLLRAVAGLGERAGEESASWLTTARRALGRLTPEHAEAVATQTFVDMLQAGYTAAGATVAVSGEAAGDLARSVVRAAERVGIGLALLPVLAEGSDETAVDALLDLAHALSGETRDRRTVRLGVAAAGLPEVAPEALAALVAGAQALDPMTPIHVPLARTPAEVAMCHRRLGAAPVDWLLSHAPVDGRWCLLHATQMTPEEARAVAASDAVVGVCPSTEANLSYGAFNLLPYFAADGHVGIGAGIGVTLDPFEELRWLEYLQRQRVGRRAVGVRSSGSNGTSLLQATAEGGGQALGRPLGRLAPGFRADWLVLDTAAPPLLGRRAEVLIDTLTFAGGAIRDVMVGGVWVVLDGVHPLRDGVRSAYRHAIQALAG